MNVRFFYRTLWVGMEKIYTAFIKLFMLHVRNVRPVLEYERPMLFLHLIREILVKDVGTILRKVQTVSINRKYLKIRISGPTGPLNS